MSQMCIKIYVFFLFLVCLLLQSCLEEFLLHESLCLCVSRKGDLFEISLNIEFYSHLVAAKTVFLFPFLFSIDT